MVTSKKIGIDARMYQESGIGRYIRNLLFYLQKLDHQNEYYILLREEEFQKLVLAKNFKKILCDVQWYSLLEQVKVLRVLNKYNLDLVHFPHFNVPVFYRKKFIVTVHDLIHQHFTMERVSTHGKVVHGLKKVGYNTAFKAAIAKSKRILVPSEFVKNLLINDWKVPDNKILVTPEAVDEGIINISSKMSKNKSLEIVQKVGIEFPYIFYLGNAHPHKNVEKLIAVFHELRQKYPQLHLVLAGHDHYFWQRLKQEAKNKNLVDNVVFTGYVTDEQAVALYKNAVAYVLPSLEEGFGIPLLEAMACSCPVVSSNRGSLPDVGKDACLYFDPENEDDMYAKIEQVLNSEKVREELIKKGQILYKKFSWKKLTEQTLEVYKAVC